MEAVIFLPSDNTDSLSPAVAHNLNVIRTTPTYLSSARSGSPSHAFLTSFLRHRARWWEVEATCAAPPLIALDEAVLRALAAGAQSTTTTATTGAPVLVLPRLDPSSWLDFAALCGASNGAPARAVLEVALAGGAIFDLRSTLACLAKSLGGHIAEAAAAAEATSLVGGKAATEALAAGVSLAADALAAVGSLLTLSPAAAYALQPADGLCNGGGGSGISCDSLCPGDACDSLGPPSFSFSSLAPGSLLYQVAAAYQHTLPALARAAARAPRAAAAAARTPLAAAAHGALSALRGVIDACYADALRASGNAGAQSVTARTGNARNNPAAIVDALTGFCLAAQALAPSPPLALVGGGGGRLVGFTMLGIFLN